MRFCIKQKQINEEEENLRLHKFSEKEMEKRVNELDAYMHKIATLLQDKVPIQVANEYFLKYIEKDKISNLDLKRSFQAGELADEEGLVRIADLFVLGEIYNNIDMSWMLDKYNKGK